MRELSNTKKNSDLTIAVTVAEAGVLAAAAHVAKRAEADVRRHAGSVHAALSALGHAGTAGRVTCISLATLASA
jgi:hypothetical protein